MKKWLKILVVTEYYPPKVFGGGEKSVQLLAESLARKGHQVTVLTSWHPGLPSLEEKGSVTVQRKIRTGPDNETLWHNFLRTIPFHVSTRRAVKALCRESKWDVVHVFNVTAMVGVVNALQAQSALNRPLLTATLNCHNAFCPFGTRLDEKGDLFEGIYTFQDFWRIYRHERQLGKLKNQWWLQINLPLALFIYLNFTRIRHAFKAADHLFAVSKAVKVFADLHIPQERVTVVHNIVDHQTLGRAVDPVRLKKLQKQYRTDTHKTVMYIGALTAIKGVETLVKAMQRVVEKEPQAQLLLVGDGPEEVHLKDLVKKLHLENQVYFVGQVVEEKILEYYHVADVFCQPSQIPEPLSRTLLEAAFLNLPIVASKVGGSLDMIQPGRNGRFAENRNPASFAHALLALLKGEINHETLKKTNRKVLKQFQEGYVVKHLEKIWR